MKFEILEAKASQLANFDLVLCGVFIEDDEKKAKGGAPLKAPKEMAEIGKALLHEFVSAAETEGFTGAFGQSFLMRTLSKDGPRAVALFGLGKKSTLASNCYRKLGGMVYKLANDKRYKRVGLFLPQVKNVDSQDAMQSTLEGFQLSKYRFDKYLTENKPQNYVEDFTLFVDDLKRKDVKNAVHQASAVCHGVCLTRDLDWAAAVMRTGNVLSGRSTLKGAKPWATVSGTPPWPTGRMSVAVT